VTGDDRALAWDGCLNVRDLGSLPTEDGARIAPGALIRGDNARRLAVGAPGRNRDLRRRGLRRDHDPEDMRRP